MTQQTIPCVVYRGGTSRGLFFHEDDLPQDNKIRNQIFIQGIGSLDASHVNGLGGGTSHTGKVAIIKKSDKEGIHIDYTFVQLGMGSDVVDYNGTCGNLMAAVGAFAVDEGLVRLSNDMDEVTVNVWNTNIKKVLHITVPIVNKQAKVSGDFVMAGVNGEGAKYTVHIVDPSGGEIGEVFPLSPQSSYEINGKEINYTFSHIVNPFVYVRANDFAMSGTELNEDVAKNKSFLNELEQIRELASVDSGIAPNLMEAREKFVSIPKIAFVSEPKDYVTSTGKKVNGESYDILARMISVGKVHRSFAVSGLLNLASTSLLKGTIPNKLCLLNATGKEQTVRIGHPEGIAEVKVKIDIDNQTVDYVGMERTARRIMAGDLYVAGG